VSDALPPDDNLTPAGDSPAADPSASTPITIERIEEILEKGDVSEEHGAIRWSSNYTFLLSVTHEDETLLTVYKPRRGERPLWDFPDGTLALRERAAFLTSQALDWQVVPPTVLREGPRGLGSFQFFVDHDPNHTYFEFDESLRPQVARLSLFDVITNNADRKGGHCLLDSQGHVWGIDHGLTFNVAHKLRTVIWDFAGQPIPPSFLEDLEALHAAMCDESHAYTGEMRTLLEHDEMTAFLHRVERLLKTRMYPRPGPGPNYPWPPV
jgi:hypothetical protein